MKPVSKETLELLNSLHGKEGLLDRFIGGSKKVELLRQIAERNEPGVLSHLFPFVFDSNRALAEEAKKAVVQLSSRLKPQDFLLLDLQIRQFSPYFVGGGWFAINKGDLRALKTSSQASVLLGLTSFHPNGHLREEAVLHLGECSDGRELPFLLIRLNDWVSNIRETTRRILETRLVPAHGRHFVSNLFFLYRLKSCFRGTHEPFIASVEELLKSQECQSVLEQGFESDDGFTRRSCLKLLLRSSGTDRVGLLKHLATHNNPVLRLIAFREVVPELSSEALRKALEWFDNDENPTLRREVLFYRISKFSSEVEKLLPSALLDKHPLIREIGRKEYERSGSSASNFYRRALAVAEPKRLIGAIAGLGETGGSTDIGLIAPFLSHDKKIILRRAAVRATGKLSKDESVGHFVELLKDGSPGVARESRNVLVSKASFLNAKNIWSVFENDSRGYVRKQALIVIYHLGKWDKIPFLVLACSDADEEIARMAKRYIQSWWSRYNRNSGLQPKKENLDLFQNAMNSAGQNVAPQLQREFNSLIKSWR